MTCQHPKVDGLRGLFGPRCDVPATHASPHGSFYCEDHMVAVIRRIAAGTSLLGVVFKRRGTVVPPADELLARWRIQ